MFAYLRTRSTSVEEKLRNDLVKSAFVRHCFQFLESRSTLMFAIAEIASLWESFHGGPAILSLSVSKKSKIGDAGECAAQIFLIGTKYAKVERFITFSLSILILLERLSFLCGPML